MAGSTRTSPWIAPQTRNGTGVISPQTRRKGGRMLDYYKPAPNTVHRWQGAEIAS